MNTVAQNVFLRSVFLDEIAEKMVQIEKRTSQALCQLPRAFAVKFHTIIEAAPFVVVGVRTRSMPIVDDGRKREQDGVTTLFRYEVVCPE